MITDGGCAVIIWTPSVTIFPSPKMCLEDVCIYHRDKKLINIDRNNLYNFIQWEECIEYWIDHGRFKDYAINLVDWETVESSIKRVENGKQRWVTKHASGNCGVSETLFKWRMQSEKICPLCTAHDESPDHVFQCPAPIPTQHRNNHFNQLQTSMEDKYTDPDIIEVIISSLRNWTDTGETTNPNTNCNDIKEAFQDQEDIHLLFGIGAKNGQIVNNDI